MGQTADEQVQTAAARALERDERIHFGGPDRPARFLRDVLEARVEAVPAGGEIHWACHYFRDRALARALVRAARRGVAVSVALAERPDYTGANYWVIGVLDQEPRIALSQRPGLDSRVYYFSHPQPSVLIGSFEPAGDEPDSTGFAHFFGDPDRGYHDLVELRDESVVAGMRAYCRALHGRRRWLPLRFDRRANRPIVGRDVAVYRYPRLRPGVVERALDDWGNGDRVRIAMSHIAHPRAVRAMAGARRRGASVEVIGHAALDNVSERAAQRLLDAGVDFYRYAHPEGVPLGHCFVLMDGRGGRRLFFGSYTMTRIARRQHEILAVSGQDALCAAFEARWKAIRQQPHLYAVAA